MVALYREPTLENVVLSTLPYQVERSRLPSKAQDHRALFSSKSPHIREGESYPKQPLSSQELLLQKTYAALDLEIEKIVSSKSVSELHSSMTQGLSASFEYSVAYAKFLLSIDEESVVAFLTPPPSLVEEKDFAEHRMPERFRRSVLQTFKKMLDNASLQILYLQKVAQDPISPKTANQPQGHFLRSFIGYSLRSEEDWRREVLSWSQGEVPTHHLMASSLSYQMAVLSFFKMDRSNLEYPLAVVEEIHAQAVRQSHTNTKTLDFFYRQVFAELFIQKVSEIPCVLGVLKNTKHIQTDSFYVRVKHAAIDEEIDPIYDAEAEYLLPLRNPPKMEITFSSADKFSHYSPVWQREEISL